MKLLLKSLTNETTNIEVSDTDTVNAIRQKLIENKKISAEFVVKLIANGVILDLDKNISNYPILKDGQIVVFMQTKQKIADVTKPIVQPITSNISNPSLTSQSTVLPLNIFANNTTNTINQDNQLPTSFSGVNIDLLRRSAFISILGAVFSSPQDYIPLLLRDQRFSDLRNVNPTEFDNIVNNPGFILSPFELPNDNLDTDTSTDPLLQQVPNANSTIRITLTTEESLFLEQIKEMAPHVSKTDILQYFIACDRNRDATLDMVLSLQPDQ